MWLVAGDCFLIGLAPVLVHMSKGPDGKFPFHPVSINLLVEVAKTVFATIVLMVYVSNVLHKMPLTPSTTDQPVFIKPSLQNLLHIWFSSKELLGAEVLSLWRALIQ